MEATINVWAGLLIVILLLCCSALVSGSEVAFFSLSPNDIRSLEQENTSSGKTILDLRKTPRMLLATILISNNFINIAVVILSDLILRQTLPPDLMKNWAEGILHVSGMSIIYVNQLASTLNFGVTVVGVTFLLVLFGEVAPKVYAKFNKLRLAHMMSGPLASLRNILYPLSQLLVKGTSIVERRLTNNTNSNTTREDIDSAIELTVKDGQNAEQEIEILKGIVKFGDISVKQIMTSRVDVIALDFRSTFQQVLKVVRNSGYSRIPVYDEDLDNIMGILYVKDLLGYLDQPDKEDWQALIRDKMYVPEAKKINDLLKDFQLKRMHMAIVVDEYGGSAGLVTLEDIMEEILGDIHDEFDDGQEVEYTKVNEYIYVFEGKTLLTDVARIANIEFSMFEEAIEEADTLAGLILEMKGRIPKKGEKIIIEHHQFEVTSVSPRRIEEVKVILPR